MTSDARFFAFLKSRIGLDVASVGEAIIERAVRQRCALNKAESADAYWQLLHSSAEEQQALIEAVIVPETWFFRYPESFGTLGKLAAARVAQLNGARPLRILSLPCSTGEEPYSIAMALFDAGLQATQFKVEAVDISPLSLQRARRAVYGKNSFRGDQLGFRERHFTQVEDGYLVSEKVREQVGFQTGNLLDPALTVAQSAYDFVFCRNLLIYFDLDTQRQGFEALKRMTREDGLLFIGPAEGSLLGRMGMVSIGIPQSFAFRHRTEPVADPFAVPPTAATLPIRPVAAPQVSNRPPPAPRPNPAPKSFGPAPVRSPAPGAPPPAGEAATLLASIKQLANEGKTAEARRACEQYLKSHEPVAPVFYWLGLLSEVSGDGVGAQGFYRKALYLEPQHPEALAQLAALLAAQGDSAGARRLQERAARGVNKEGRSR
ncbi:protein-glutamate O-methyltransferase CheR [Pseudomonas sp. GD03842]|uniref:CheR family methyltransferase n=1 Tax=unclassified Pseudomonas TaxID=196821 RepID=UPI000D38C655|nr:MULTISPECIES: protein-glutamate O-methyltransferase CheR [unclassified Pseudomonas]MDH0749684.1 protein-glutamate O-methyltransferase CheR [Pseudomonas sp. GD03842]RAU49505.1 protein-glutamate O-methyltransferase CheR [Pseudomonas sp. RIT 409]RAU55756.1 protein-glutamate O-methyltransferase CheR [Pseudomonas sp. RIT 412]